MPRSARHLVPALAVALAACRVLAAPAQAEIAADALAPAVVAASSAAAGPQGDPLFEERLEADLRLVEALRRALEHERPTLETWRRELPDADRNEEDGRDLGFGARRTALTAHGGHTSARVVLLSVEGAIARVSVRQSPHDAASWRDAAPHVARAWETGAPAKFTARPGEKEIAAERADAELVAALDARRALELGEARPESPPGEHEAAYRELLDPFAPLWVGTSCGFLGAPPPGRESSQALVAARRFDLLRCVLRGPNPEARAYAAHALLEHGLASEADAAAIETLSSLPVRLITCVGCIVHTSDWQGALRTLGEG